MEAALTVLSVAEGTVPPTANLTEREGAVGPAVPTTTRAARIRTAVSTSAGFGGPPAALVVTAP
ncbi:hypothetical protein [Streptomyces griseus]|uniref:hypothetical protein n=1 Tax=Streptomyces griseus TaxID=1911 RepID=UPI00068B8A8A|nr:hypothetical protein [Streptomyces griseus]